MNCFRTQALLSAYVDREVTGSEMLAIREHLRACECCREEEETLRAVKLALCSAEMVEPSPDFEERLVSSVMSRVRMSEHAEVLPLWQRRPFLVFSGVAACAMLGLVFINPGASPTASPAGKASALTSPASKGDSSHKAISTAIQRDNAYISSSDPLSGPQMAISASYGRP